MQEQPRISAGLSKEIGRISRNFLELSIESFKMLNFVANYLEYEGSEKSKRFIRDEEGFKKWLISLTDFSKFIRKHIQDGRLSLLNYLGEEKAFYELKEKQNKKIDKKSLLLAELDTMLQSVFNLRQAPAEVKQAPVIAPKPADQAMQKYVKQIDPNFITIQQEPIDIAHLKKSQYLIGSYDGSLILRDIKDPTKDVTLKQHLRNRATWIRSIVLDSDKKVWVATSNELTVYQKSFKIVMQARTYNPTVKFYGHFRTLWADKKGQYIFWWCDRDSIKIFHSRTFKVIAKLRGLMKHDQERPNHYSFLDGDYKKLFLVTNNPVKPNIHYTVEILKRKVHGGDESLPQPLDNMQFAHICVAYNSCSSCIVTTGISARLNSTNGAPIKKDEQSHVTIFKLDKKLKLSLVDYYLNPDLKLMNISSIIFHKPHHTRILAVQTKHVLVIDFVYGKLQVLFSVRDINRGECVHHMVRLSNSYLFVGNFGQIFKIDFNPSFFDDRDKWNPEESGMAIKDEDNSQRNKKDGFSGHQIHRKYEQAREHQREMEAEQHCFDPMIHSPGPIGFMKDSDIRKFTNKSSMYVPKEDGRMKYGFSGKVHSASAQRNVHGSQGNLDRTYSGRPADSTPSSRGWNPFQRDDSKTPTGNNMGRLASTTSPSGGRNPKQPAHKSWNNLE